MKIEDSWKMNWTRLLIFQYCYQIAMCLQCYTDIEGKQVATCNELEGFKTCFTKYNDSKFHPSAFPFGIVQKYQEATVTGRGCSTKDKVFYRECQTHSYGDTVEKMCFCSFQLCNAAPEAKAARHSTAKCSGLLALCVLFLAANWTMTAGAADCNVLLKRKRKKRKMYCTEPPKRRRKRRRRRSVTNIAHCNHTRNEEDSNHRCSNNSYYYNNNEYDNLPPIEPAPNCCWSSSDQQFISCT